MEKFSTLMDVSRIINNNDTSTAISSTFSYLVRYFFPIQFYNPINHILVVYFFVAFFCRQKWTTTSPKSLRTSECWFRWKLQSNNSSSNFDEQYSSQSHIQQSIWWTRQFRYFGWLGKMFNVGRLCKLVSITTIRTKWQWFGNWFGFCIVEESIAKWKYTESFAGDGHIGRWWLW